MTILILVASLASNPAPVRVPPPAPAIAQPAPVKPVDPAALASAKKLIGMMHVDQTIDHMMARLVSVMAPAVLGALEHNEATREPMQAMESQPNGRERLMAIFSDEFLKAFRARYPAILESAAQEYAAVFTAKELDQAIAFYSTGTGAKFLALSPQLQQAVGARAGQIGREAGMEAGQRAMLRAAQEILPPLKTGS